MTIAEVISKTDKLCPNQYDTETKLAWLSQLDGRIYDELWKSHWDRERDSFENYESVSEELLVPFIYGDDLYVYYLCGKIAAQNGETAKYNQFIELYNTEYQTYCDYYNRTHMPKPKWWANRFKF